ncbi:MAG: hypothetical protein C0622_00515 [Desulfuromonas sp.]|nr:MAG: hypothetical protein C0622_00515 [Desulfuromonas sp.]
MAKKKKTGRPAKQMFSSNPFSDLKGFSVSGEEVKVVKEKPPVPEEKPLFGNFSDEMELLGVKRLERDEEEEPTLPEADEAACVEPCEGEQKTDEELFLAAMTEMQVNFSDRFPEEEPLPQAQPRRMKQLRRGRLVPDATLDLHGCLRSEVVPRLTHFLQNARYHGWRTLLVITGKGLHSEEGEPLLRNEVERFLVAESQAVSEWTRAPREYGGDGALILFL